MRIFAADALGDKDTAINAIPVNYIKKGDLCIVKISTSDPDFKSAVYFYEYLSNFGEKIIDINDVVYELPNVIIPLDQFKYSETQVDEDLNPILTDDSGRWVMKNIFANGIDTQTLRVNTIVPFTEGFPITIGDNFTVDHQGVIVDGQVTINSEPDVPPLIVSSNVMVENLNAEYIGGSSFADFMRNDDHHFNLAQGTEELVVTLPRPMLDPPHYSVMIDMCNLVDENPAIYSWIITDKSENTFTLRFSGIIDSPNYTLHYFLIGPMSEFIPDPNEPDPVVDPDPVVIPLSQEMSVIVDDSFEKTICRSALYVSNDAMTIEYIDGEL